MAIPKPEIMELRYVNGLPDTTLRPDQQRINYCKNGEAPTGASGDTVTDGTLNRGPVQIQSNVLTLHNNIKAHQDSIGVVIDAVNELTGGSGADIGQRLTDTETDVSNNKSQIENHTAIIGQDGTIQGQSKTGLYLNIQTNADNIGFRPVTDIKNSSLSDSSLRAEQWFIKSQLIGNKRNYDPNGNFNELQYPSSSGIFAELEANSTKLNQNIFTLNEHADRLTDLEENSAAGAVADIREDVGDRTETGYNPAVSILARLNLAENALVTNTQHLTDIDNQLNVDGLVSDIDTLQVTVGNLGTTSSQHGSTILDIQDSIGDWTNLSGDIRDNIENNYNQVESVWSVLGTGAWASQTTTIRYRLNDIDLKVGELTDDELSDTLLGYSNRYLKSTGNGSIFDHENRLIELANKTNTTALTDVTDKDSVIEVLQELINRIKVLEQL